ncbi:MAG: 23S rRNA (guanosine(2251)-2'-O)-methyltransferase RlmB [Bacilli bacterium]|nr:23S rRNA (guanosine(2251)-2'-O)-methyltransferase RlmB [Bacilli bacterium]
MALLIYGRNSVRSAITSHSAQKIYVAKNFRDVALLNLIKQEHLTLKTLDHKALTSLVKNDYHQGIVAEVKGYNYYSLSDLIADGKQISNPIIIMLDGINDPHNFGAILRIADAFNVVGVVVKKDGQVPLNATVAKVSTGAINYVKVAEVSNLNNAIAKLKEAGYWIIATDGEAKDSYTKLDYALPLVLVIGSEGRGISQLVKNNSDFLIKIPMFGHVNSLNASNALSVILAHIISCRIPS